MTERDIERKYEAMLCEFERINQASWKYSEVGRVLGTRIGGSRTIEIMKVQRMDELIIVMQDILNELKKLTERGKDE